MNRIRIHIDHLVVDALPAGGERGIREALARELGSRFADGQGAGAITARHIPSITLTQATGNNAQPWTSTVARAISGELGRSPQTPSNPSRP